MIVALVLISGFMIFAMNGRSLVPTRIQSMAEIVYEYVASMVTREPRRGRHEVLPLGILDLHLHPGAQFHRPDPGIFTVTSHIIVTFALAAMVWIVVTIIGFWKHGARLSAGCSCPTACLSG